MTAGRVLAYVGTGVGLFISVSANVVHATSLPSVPAWAPWLGAAWPVLLFLGLEVLTRTGWGNGRAVWVARVGVGVVASVAAWLSYEHLHGVLLMAGETGISAWMGPLAIDGLMATSAAALLAGEHPETGTVPETETETEGETEGETGTVPETETVPATGTGTVPERGAVPERSPVAGGVRVVAERSPVRRVKAGGPVKATDEDLLARLGGLVASGEVTAGEITKTRVRALLGVGDTRAARLAGTWHDSTRRAAVHAVGQ